MGSDALGVSARRLRSSAAVLVLVVVGLASCPSQARAQQPTPQDRETARALMQEGDAKVEDKDHAGALDAYQKAHAIMGVPSTGIEVARMLAALGRLIEAREMALSVLRMTPSPNEPKPFAKARTDAQKLADELDERIPSVVIKVEGASSGAAIRVKIDGATIPADALEQPRSVDPGKHVVTASADGAAEVSKEVTVAERDRSTVSISLGDAGPSSKISPLVFAGFGVGAAGLIVGAVTGGFSLANAASVHKTCPDNKCPTEAARKSVQADNDRALILANVSNVGLALGIVGAGAGVAGIFLSGGDKKSEPTAASVHIDAGLGYLGLSGKF